MLDPAKEFISIFIFCGEGFKKVGSFGVKHPMKVGGYGMIFCPGRKGRRRGFQSGQGALVIGIGEHPCPLLIRKRKKWD